jgi:hypothetical protein
MLLSVIGSLEVGLELVIIVITIIGRVIIGVA